MGIVLGTLGPFPGICDNSSGRIYSVLLPEAVQRPVVVGALFGPEAEGRGGRVEIEEAPILEGGKDHSQTIGGGKTSYLKTAKHSPG
jgi:hypothetical protein